MVDSVKDTGTVKNGTMSCRDFLKVADGHFSFNMGFISL